MKKFFEKNLIWFGIFLFLLAKLYLILPVTASLSIPRAGDDALVYLWKGNLVNKDSNGMKAIRDIEAQTKSSKDEVNFTNSRVAQRILKNTIIPFYNYLTFIALKLTPSTLWAYFALEIIGLIAMTAGISWFIFELSGPKVAGLTLIIMAFAILPKQGINSYIPSTMAMSCSLILWAYLWRSKKNTNFFIATIAILIIPGLHPIGKIYIALTPLIFFLCLEKHKTRWSWPIAKIFLISICSIFFWFLAAKIFTILKIPKSYSMGNIDIKNGFLINLSSIPNQLNTLFLLHNLLWVYGISVSIFSAPFYKTPKNLKWLLFGGLFALCVSLAYTIPGYPGELFSRLWVVVFLFISAIGSYYLLTPSSKKILLIKIILGIFLFFCSIAFWVIKYVPDSMNDRKEILIESILENQIKNIPLDTTLLYTDTDIALQAAFLFGADRLGALAYPLLKNIKNIDNLIKNKKPPLIISIPYNQLNSISTAKAKSFIKRRQGLNFKYVSNFEIQKQKGTSLSSVYFNLQKNDTNHSFIVWQALNENGEILKQGNFEIQNGWTELKLPYKSEILRVTLPESSIWVLGLRSAKENNQVLWPWREHWKIIYNLRYKKKDSIIIDFTPEKLLEYNNAKYLNNYINHEDPVLSDNGGLVFFRTIFN